jgi:hypothetical protein
MVESGAKDNLFVDITQPKKAKPVLGSRRAEIINKPPPKKVVSNQREPKSKDNQFI